MTTRDPRAPEPVDIDLLADYTCGVLAGTPDEIRIGGLVERDPEWAAAYRALYTADPLIRANLSELGAAPTTTMPPDLLDRIIGALPAEPLRPTPPTAPVHQLDTARRRKRRLAGWTFASAAAVIVVALLGVFGIGSLVSNTRTSNSSADRKTAAGPAPSRTADGMAPHQAPGQSDNSAPPPGVLAADVALTASGADYTLSTLPKVAALSGSASLDAATRKQVPDELHRLTAPAALAECLQTIAVEHPGTPRLADYARFNGRPGLVVVVGTGSAAGFVVAGPACGTDGADIRYQTAR